MSLPILYSFVRCPYAMRARMACCRANTDIEIREVNLKDKPAELLQASPKGTVPVFIHPDGRIIAHSADIVKEQLASIAIPCDDAYDQALIEAFNKDFIPALQHYKYSDRYPNIDHNITICILKEFLIRLNEHLTQRGRTELWNYLDIMLLPLVRQCFLVDPDLFTTWGYHAVDEWIQSIINHEAFANLMKKRDPWNNND